jgi:hypothetical protein
MLKSVRGLRNKLHGSALFKCTYMNHFYDLNQYRSGKKILLVHRLTKLKTYTYSMCTLAAWSMQWHLPPRRLELWVVRSNPARILGSSFNKT